VKGLGFHPLPGCDDGMKIVLSDEEHMRICLELARRAGERGEVPVGALVVRAGEVVAEGSNRPIGDSDPTGHAEIVALRAAARSVDNYRLPDCELFVTVEPCMMCVGAIVQARISRVVFGCYDAKAGFAGSLADYSDDARLNHRFAVRGGVLEAEASELLRAFFRSRR
jgi:tRNA(adenine34) deaminase